MNPKCQKYAQGKKDSVEQRSVWQHKRTLHGKPDRLPSSEVGAQSQRGGGTRVPCLGENHQDGLLSSGHMPKFPGVGVVGKQYS